MTLSTPTKLVPTLVGLSALTLLFACSESITALSPPPDGGGGDAGREADTGQPPDEGLPDAATAHDGGPSTPDASFRPDASVVEGVCEGGLAASRSEPLELAGLTENKDAVARYIGGRLYLLLPSDIVVNDSYEAELAVVENMTLQRRVRLTNNNDGPIFHAGSAQGHRLFDLASVGGQVLSAIEASLDGMPAVGFYRSGEFAGALDHFYSVDSVLTDAAMVPRSGQTLVLHGTAHAFEPGALSALELQTLDPDGVPEGAARPVSFDGMVEYYQPKITVDADGNWVATAIEDWDFPGALQFETPAGPAPLSFGCGVTNYDIALGRDSLITITRCGSFGARAAVRDRTSFMETHAEDLHAGNPDASGPTLVAAAALPAISGLAGRDADVLAAAYWPHDSASGPEVRLLDGQGRTLASRTLPAFHAGDPSTLETVFDPGTGRLSVLWVHDQAPGSFGGTGYLMEFARCTP